MSHWIYHPDHPAKIVSSAEYPVFLREGWFDSPAKFCTKNEDVPRETLEIAKAPEDISSQKINDKPQEEIFNGTDQAPNDTNEDHHPKRKGKFSGLIGAS